MNCEKCGKDHEGDFGSGRNCSMRCSRSHPRSEEDKNKIRSGVNHWISKLKAESPYEWAKYQQLLSERGKERTGKKIITKETPWDNLGIDSKRRRVFEEQGLKCNKCSLGEWLGIKLILELEHIDGDNQNNSRNNLEGLCPNCHSLTATWRGRNKNTNQKRVSDEDLVKALLNTKNIRQALIAVGLSPRGKNYIRAGKLKSIIQD